MKRVLFILLVLSVSCPAHAAKTTFSDGNPATRSPGTKVTAAFLNAVNKHRHDGQAVDGSGALDYAVDTGAANAIVVSLSPVLSGHIPGMPIVIKVSAENTGSTVINVSGLGDKALKKLGNTDLQSGDLRAGQIITIAYDGVNYQLLAPPPNSDAITLNGQTAAMLAPPGAILDFGMSVCPAGWIETNGSTVLRAQYAALFAAIGTTWGVGDGVSTFHLPDLRGEFRRTWDHGRGVDTGRTMATWQDHLFQQHTHSGVPVRENDASDGLAASTVSFSADQNTGPAVTGNVGSETRPRNIAVLSCIKY